MPYYLHLHFHSESTCVLATSTPKSQIDMESGLILNLPVGRVAAILTVFEFVIGTATTLAIRGLIRGIWLFKLHKNGKASVNAKARSRRGLVRDFVTSAFGILLVASAALVESQLQSTVEITENPISSKACVRVDRPLDPDLLGTFVPPIQLIVEPWVLLVAQQIKNGINKNDRAKAALATVGVGGTTTLKGEKAEMFAPVSPKLKSIDPHLIVFDITEVKVQPNRLSIKPGKTPAVEIFPFSTDGIDTSEKTEAHNEPLDAYRAYCESKQLSSLRIGLHTYWRSSYSQSMNVMQAVHDSICKYHREAIADKSNERPLKMEEIEECGIWRVTKMNPNCLREKAVNLSLANDNVPESSVIFSVDMSNSSALFYGKSRTDSSYACIDATINVEYVLLEAGVLNSLSPNRNEQYPFIVPTRYTVKSGHCERTIHLLARTALLHSADVEWRMTDLAKLDRIRRYWSFMISASSALVDLTEIDVEDKTAESNCSIHPVRSITFVRYSWSVVLLVSITSICAILIVIASVYRLYYRGPPWLIGSAYWSLNQFCSEESQGEDGCNEHTGIKVLVHIRCPQEPQYENNQSVEGGQQPNSIMGIQPASFGSSDVPPSSRAVIINSLTSQRQYGQNILRRMTTVLDRRQSSD